MVSFLLIFADVKKLCFGASNIRRNETQLHQELSNCQYVLTYTFEELKKEIHLINDKIFDIIIIHILTNDISGIVHPKKPKYFKSIGQKQEELYDFVHDFNSFIIHTAASMSNTHFFISLCLPRYDNRDQLPMLNGREFVNEKIYNSLYSKRNITLIWNEDFSKRHFLSSDFFHLNCNGFSKLMSNWKNAIGNSQIICILFVVLFF